MIGPSEYGCKQIVFPVSGDSAEDIARNLNKNIGQCLPVPYDNYVLRRVESVSISLRDDSEYNEVYLAQPSIYIGLAVIIVEPPPNF